MRTLKTVFRFIFSRLFLVGLMIVVQIVLVVGLLMYFSQSTIYVYLCLNALSFIAVVGVVSNAENPSYKLTWVIAILLLPLTGGLFYLFFGNKRMPAQLRRRVDGQLAETLNHMPPNDIARAMAAESPHLARQCRYIYNVAGYPAVEGTSSEYYPIGEMMFARMAEEMRKAERFIMLEYFIISPGYVWDTVFRILREKAAAGVEVMLMYDDIGSIATLPPGFNRAVTEAGIRLCVFNPFRPRVSMIMNHRDHRKILVVDGHTAFCGGINLADEYVNRHERFGHWKDTGIMLRGEACWSFTYMFLQQWQFETRDEIDFEKYRAHDSGSHGDGIVQAFGDSPLDRDNVTENAYINIISRATQYVYITTPYLIIDNEMESALRSAAEAGIDVRIIAPHIYDKWYVHLLTQSHYAELIRSGVKIYEYTPGFIHSKMFVADDQICMVGTCNMDFRSFYLHFECSAVFYFSRLIEQVKKDMLDCQSLSHLVTFEETQHIRIGTRIIRALLKILAPLF